MDKDSLGLWYKETCCVCGGELESEVYRNLLASTMSISLPCSECRPTWEAQRKQKIEEREWQDFKMQVKQDMTGCIAIVSMVAFIVWLGWLTLNQG